jgi:pimeloyl-ACP methyl ester carboxylesterase
MRALSPLAVARTCASVALIVTTTSAPVSGQRPLTRDTAMVRATDHDRLHLRAAQTPSAEQEQQWKQTAWRDVSPHQSTIVDANGQRLHVLDWGGRGPAMVFLPGMGHTAHVFDDFAPRFRDRYHVLALTLRGHGSSSAPSHPYTVDSLAADVHEALLALHLHDVVLAGHSLGGHVANRVAALYPNAVSRVVYLDAAKDSTGLAALRAAAPSVRPEPGTLVRGEDARAHWAQRRLYFNYWSDAQEADYRSGRTAPEIAAMSDLYALQDWHLMKQPQLDVCALDTAAVQFPWLEGAERARLADRIAAYVNERFVPWERASCIRFARQATNATLVTVPASNHYVFLVSPEQSYVAITRWLQSTTSRD